VAYSAFRRCWVGRCGRVFLPRPEEWLAHPGFHVCPGRARASLRNWGLLRVLPSSLGRGLWRGAGNMGPDRAGYRIAPKRFTLAVKESYATQFTSFRSESDSLCSIELTGTAMAILADVQRDERIPPQPTPPPHLAPMQSLELRIRWLEALLYGARHDDSLAGLREPKPELKHGETLIRAAEHAQRRMDDIASTYEVLRKFISHCKDTLISSALLSNSTKNQTNSMRNT
jgi:hypothetical protein